VIVRNDFRREVALEGLVSMISCAYLYTCPFWVPIGFNLREERIRVSTEWSLPKGE